MEMEKPKMVQQENNLRSIWLEKKSFHISLISMFTALAVVSGYLLASLPNIEVFTLMIFLSGFIIGKKDGAIVGLMSSVVFVFFNPYGASPLPLFCYQVIHYSLTGFTGGFAFDFLKSKPYFKPNNDLYTLPMMIIFGLMGAIITFIYDIITTIIGTIVFMGTLDAFFIYYISGILFTTVHLIGNMLGFIFILPGLIQVIYKILKQT
ncbi:MAG: hypothetical protein ACTSXH_03655 [Promethearchaeota archaeon]